MVIFFCSDVLNKIPEYKDFHQNRHCTQKLPLIDSKKTFFLFRILYKVQQEYKKESQMWSFSWCVFSSIWTEYGDLRSIWAVFTQWFFLVFMLMNRNVRGMINNIRGRVWPTTNKEGCKLHELKYQKVLFKNKQKL